MASNKMNLHGTFLGKRIFVYDAKIDCEEKDIEKLLIDINRLSALNFITKISPKLFKPQNTTTQIDDIPITENILIDAAWRIIRYTPPNGGKDMTSAQFIQLLKMSFKMLDKQFGKGGLDPYEIISKIAYTQFRYQENPYNTLARNLYIYFELWSKIPKCNQFNVLLEIESIIGLSYDIAIAYCITLVANQNGYFFPNKNDGIKELCQVYGKDITEDEHKKFLNWCSAGYDFYSNHSDMLNPFVLFPIVNTASDPIKCGDDLYIIVSYSNLYYKISDGIYFSLVDKFNLGEGKNEFKEKFGYVFEEYIGVLLKEHMNNWQIHPEIKYKKGKNEINSVDWFVYRDGKLLLIEVKQSSIFLKSKESAKIKDIRDDLENTMVKAAKQLKRSREDIISKKYSEFSAFHDTKEFQLLIVTNDPLYNANLVCKKLISDSTGLAEKDFNIININEFETFLDNQSTGQTLFDLLTFKNLNYNEFDFKEYLLEIYPNGNGERRFLKKYYDGFFDKFKENKEQEQSHQG
jgi:hypothetical protein